MKKVLFIMSFFGFTSCSVKTVKNNYTDSIKVGINSFGAGSCIELNDSIVGYLSDFPITITKEDGSNLSDIAKKDKEYKVANYIVNADGSIVESDESCVESADDDASEKTPSEETPSEETPSEETPSGKPAESSDKGGSGF